MKLVAMAAVAISTAFTLSAGSVTPDKTIDARVIGALPGIPQLHVVSFPDARHGFLAVTSGCFTCGPVLLATGNAGHSWRVVKRGIPFSLLSFPSARTGFAVDARGNLLKTVNGGRRWSRLRSAPSHLTSLDFTNDRRGWVSAGSLLAYTRNGGRDWSRLASPCLPTFTIAGISFVNGRTGFVLCHGASGPFTVTLYRTDTTGTSWRKVSVVARMAHTVGSMDFISTTVGYVEGPYGGLERTDTGGRTFRPVSASVFLLDGSEIQASWVSGRTGYALAHNVLMRTTDAGVHWNQIYPALRPQDILSLTVSGAGVAAGSPWYPDQILMTHNGAIWTAGPRLPTGQISSLVRPPTSTAIWAVGESTNRSTFRVQLYRSRDGGRTWRRMLTERGGIGSLTFVSRRVGFLSIAAPGGLYRTVDAGATWRAVRQTQKTWNDTFISASHGWAFGEGGTLLLTTDGGSTWTRVPIHVAGLRTAILSSVAPRTVWIAGPLCGTTPCRPTLLRTSDGGAHWTLIRLPRWFVEGPFDWVSAHLGYVAVDGALYRTRDGGVHWLRVV